MLVLQVGQLIQMAIQHNLMVGSRSRGNIPQPVKKREKTIQGNDGNKPNSATVSFFMIDCLTNLTTHNSEVGGAVIDLMKQKGNSCFPFLKKHTLYFYFWEEFLLCKTGNKLP